jgi:hypothetical protein
MKPDLTYANVMATIAVFGVLAGGGAYAASKIGADDIAKNAVRSKHIKKNAVKTAKIAAGAVTARKFADGVSRTSAFSFRTSADETANNLVNAGGLTIDVSCAGTTVTATAATSVDNSSIYTASFDTSNAADPVDNQDNDADFDTGDPMELLGENDELQVGHTSYAAGTGGPVVNVFWSSDSTPNVDCLFVGNVTVG